MRQRAQKYVEVALTRPQDCVVGAVAVVSSNPTCARPAPRAETSPRARDRLRPRNQLLTGGVNTPNCLSTYTDKQEVHTHCNYRYSLSYGTS